MLKWHKNNQKSQKPALWWTGLPFNIGFMAQLKNFPPLLRRNFVIWTSHHKGKKKNFPKKIFFKKVKTIANRLPNRYPDPHPPPTKPATCQFSLHEQGVLTQQDLDGPSFCHTQALQTIASSYTKLHWHEQMDFHLPKCWKNNFKWSNFTTPEHQQHICHTEGLKAMAHHSEIGAFWRPGLQKL